MAEESMKKLLHLIVLLVLFSPLQGIGGQYENSWINYGQPYYKVVVSKDGIYRLTVKTLLGNGMPVLGWDINKVQIFHNGVEQYLYVYDSDGNGVLNNNNDYIEFYGEKNDGSFDTQMYA